MNPFERLLYIQPDVRVVDSSIPFAQYIAIDLSVSNYAIDAEVAKNPLKFESYIADYLLKNQSEIAYGGYNEQRKIYSGSAIFNGDGSEMRDIHIGIDLWCNAGTQVLAALDGIVHSFANNNAPGDYGPTIILEHVVNEQKFFTLYGHLALEDIEHLNVGKPFEKGKKIGTLGTSTVNGGYAPHLHFQVIKKIGDCFGDYPGVCSKNDLEFYLDNCPDPEFLLKINAL